METPKVGLPDQATGGGRPGRASKREKKRMREEMKRRELEGRAARKGTKADAAIEEQIRSIAWIFPNSAKMLRDHHLRSP
jgi:hypothetical protein